MPPSQDWLTASAWALSIMTWTLLITWSLHKRLLLLLVSQPQLVSLKLADPEFFEGLGKLSEPFSITLNPDVKPIQVPPNRYAIIKGALDKLIQTGQLVRVNEPTAWISNMVVRERPASATSY